MSSERSNWKSPGVFAAVFLAVPVTAWTGEELRCIDPAQGMSRCVVVGPSDLAHTSQFSAPGVDTLKGQMQETLKQVDLALKSRGSALDQAVKLNIYVTQDSATPEVQAVLGETFSGEHSPAVCFVTTRLPWPRALVALDAVGVSSEDRASSEAENPEASKIGSACRLLPQGPRVYISGQAEKGDGTLADATRQTLASLQRTLEFLGLDKRHVVQVKSFLMPMAHYSQAEQEIAKFFAGMDVPPCVYVEWNSSLPIEIELIVAADDVPALRKGPAVEVRTPPGMTTPAIYSRLTIVRHPVTIYTSGLYPADASAAPEHQLRSLFSNLKRCLDETGSDWMHLVKATYYVNDEELNKQHNLVRPDYFSPRRPPAASKAMVAGTGQAGQGICMDFIVVPGEP